MNAHLERAILLVEQSRHELAEKELRQVLAEEPGEALAHSLLGLCLCSRKEYQAATEEAELAIHHAPAMSYAHYVLSRIMFARNRFTEARSSIAEAIRLSPEDADYFAQLAQVELSQSNWTQALAAAEKGLEHDSEHVSCANLHAMALVKLGRKREAGAAIGAALSRQPDDATTHATQGWTLLEQNQPEKAMEHFKEALRLEPNNEWARRGIVEALKARYFIYSLMLRYFLWTSRLGRNRGMLFVIAGYLGNNALRSLAISNPAWGPYIQPLLWAYFAFVIMTWIAPSLFNLVLRTNKFGRLALSAEQIRASNLIGTYLFLAVAGAVSWLAFGWLPGEIVLLSCGIMVVPISGTFACSVGWPRNLMAVYTVALGIAGAIVIGIVVADYYSRISAASGWVGLFHGALQFQMWGVFISSFAANFLASVSPKR